MQITEITPKINQKTEKIRIAPYCRVSSDSADQIHSFVAQIRYYSDYEKENPQYQIVDIYADEGITGTEMEKRDEFNRMIRDCQRGKIDRIITKAVSRFARNTEELIATLRVLKDLGVSVYFEEQGIDTQQLNMEMIVTFPGMAAQKESETISGNVRWGVKKRMESGEYITPRPPYGYKNLNGSMIIDQEQTCVIRRIFNLYLQGTGIQQIANMLNLEKIPSPNYNGSKRWSFSTLRYILKNEKYIGDSLLHKRYTTETLPYRRKHNHGEKEMYYVENSHPAIISREIFGKVQKLLGEKTCKKGRENTSVFAKKIRCPECGGLFQKKTTRGKRYWCCSLNAVTGECKSRRIREEMLYETFTVMAYKLKENRQALLENLILQLEDLRNRTSDNVQRVRQIDKEIADLSAKNLVVTRLHTNGIIGVAEYSMQTSEIENKISALRVERKKKLTEDENNMFLDEVRELNEIIKNHEPSSVFNEELFEKIVEKIVVEDSSRITYYLIGGIALTEEIKEKGRCKTA